MLSDRPGTAIVGGLSVVLTGLFVAGGNAWFGRLSTNPSSGFGAEALGWVLVAAGAAVFVSGCAGLVQILRRR
jgi:hypothetical protein